jgi:hypothetical protein
MIILIRNKITSDRINKKVCNMDKTGFQIHVFWQPTKQGYDKRDIYNKIEEFSVAFPPPASSANIIDESVKPEAFVIDRRDRSSVAPVAVAATAVAVCGGL